MRRGPRCVCGERSDVHARSADLLRLRWRRVSVVGLMSRAAVFGSRRVSRRSNLRRPTPEECRSRKAEPTVERRASVVHVPCDEARGTQYEPCLGERSCFVAERIVVDTKRTPKRPGARKISEIIA
jgi:hypothetical protein